MKIKLEEFLKLTQGTSSVMEYVGKFNYLAQYVSSYVNNATKKVEYFMKGMGPKMQALLATCNLANFNDLVSAVINLEEKYSVHSR